MARVGPPMNGSETAPFEMSTRDEGQGPVVLLLHGIGANHTVWNGLVPVLATSFRILAPDLRGHGRTPAPAGSTLTFDELEADVLELLRSRDVSSAHVVGVSGGALLGLKLALDHPERVRSLIMISGAAYVDQHTRSVADRWKETLESEGPDAFALRVLKDLYYPDWIEAHLDYADVVRALAPKTDFAPAWKWAQAMQGFDERNRIAGLRKPTLIIQAMDDLMIDASHGRILRQTIPGAQIRIFPQTGHMVPIERPEETATAIREFVTAAESQSMAGAPA